MQCTVTQKKKLRHSVIIYIGWVGIGAVENLILFVNGFVMKMKLYIALYTYLSSAKENYTILEFDDFYFEIYEWE